MQVSQLEMPLTTMLQGLEEKLNAIVFGFHFKHKHQFESTRLDFIPLNGLVCLGKTFTASTEHILTYQEM